MNTQKVDYRQLSDDYQRIEQAIQYLEKNYQYQPELREIAESIGLSEYHFQRLFTRWVGISPKRFLQFLTKEGAKDLLRRSSVLNATYSVGLSSPGRLHDLFVTTEAVTPGEYKARGAGLTIRYGFHPTPFGECLLGVTERGICHLGFVQGSPETALANLKSDWKDAGLLEDAAGTGPLIAPIFSLGLSPAPVALFLSGSNFQLKVWEALLRVPQGSVTTYEQIAAQIGQPKAARAVGTAVGHNPVAVLIPCHRVIRKMGEFGNYRYGPARKKAMLGWEASLAAGQ
ncbi:MAG: methylated-DNA--[protein]-cysteine S-methyltransferase [Chloroflexi bacterium]|nr:MAG: methylated-DNA--[protein]-cysteine S-methyltransferase [Chloroflexota bacterium]